MNPPLRIGILGCAAVAEYALVAPAQEDTGIVITAAASRNPAGAAEYAKRNHIPRVVSYEELLRAPDVDAIYVALPNGMHCEWSIRAMEAGKAVLCEKPLASNAHEVELMAAAAARTGGKLVEALHWRYHPLAERLQQIVASGVLGEIVSIDTRFLIPAQYAPDDNIRFDYALGGGSTMDAGSYCISLLRHLLGEPVQVRSATPVLHSAQIDSAMQAELAFKGGVSGRFHCSHRYQGEHIAMDALLTGSEGTLSVLHPFTPQWGNKLELNIRGKVTTEEVTTVSTYHFQAKEFVRIVRENIPIRTPAGESLANMRVVDEVYRRAGLRVRGEPQG